MILPSKELLSAVFKMQVSKVIKVKKSKIFYDTEFNKNWTMNHYQLTHYMKSWADTLDYIIFSSISSCEVNESYTFDAKTEFEAVTKACEWILEQQ